MNSKKGRPLIKFHHYKTAQPQITEDIPVQ